MLVRAFDLLWFLISDHWTGLCNRNKKELSTFLHISLHKAIYRYLFWKSPILTTPRKSAYHPGRTHITVGNFPRRELTRKREDVHVELEYLLPALAFLDLSAIDSFFLRGDKGPLRFLWHLWCSQEAVFESCVKFFWFVFKEVKVKLSRCYWESMQKAQSVTNW